MGTITVLLLLSELKDLLCLTYLLEGDPKITVSLWILWQVAKRFKGDDCSLVQCMPRISTFRIPATARQLKNHFGTAEQTASVQKSQPIIFLYTLW
jgi:hypothetical protein